MATIDTGRTYVLTNSFIGSSRNMAVDPTDSTLTMADAETLDTNAEWFLTEADFAPFYRLHTVLGGAGQSLDIVNTNGTNSTALRMTSTLRVAGQFWRLDLWPSTEGTEYPYRLSNNFTGPDAHLDTYSDILTPHLASGDFSGQHWALGIAPSSTSSSSVASPTAGSSSATAAASTNPPTASTSGSSQSLSVGAIVGIVVGSLAVLAVILGIIAYVVSASRKKARRQPHDHNMPMEMPTDMTPTDPKYAISPPPAYKHLKRGYEDVNRTELDSSPTAVELPTDPARVEAPAWR